jgi:hypothetical protein
MEKQEQNFSGFRNKIVLLQDFVATIIRPYFSFSRLIFICPVYRVDRMIVRPFTLFTASIYRLAP